MFQPELTEKPLEGEASNSESGPLADVRPAARPYLHEVGTPQPKGMVRASAHSIHAVRSERPPIFLPKIPVITGEATYRGVLRVDGAISGQLGSNGGAVILKQRPRTDSEPELDGEITFNGMLRVNGHVAGSLRSEKGTLIVDVEALVDADINVAVAIIDGTVNGDVIAHQRLELGLKGKINGNIWTRSLNIKPGAIFEGQCRVLRDQENTGTA